MIKDIEPYHSFQLLPNSCAQACISIASRVFNHHLPAEIDMFRQMYDFYWDGTKPTAIEKFALEHQIPFKLYRDQTLENVKALIDEGAVVMALVFDFYPSALGCSPEGHYILIKDINFKREEIAVVDPAKEPRFYKPDGRVSVVRNGYKPQIKSSYILRFEDLAWHDEVEPGVQGNGYLLAFEARSKL